MSLAVITLLPLLLAAASSPGSSPGSAPGSSPGVPGDPSDPSNGANAAVPGRDDVKLLLDVQINGQPVGKVGEFILRRNKLMAHPDELRALGLVVPLSRAAESNALIALSDLPGVTYKIDEKTQSVSIMASNGALLPTVLVPNYQSSARDRRSIESGTGLSLNDDVVMVHTSSGTGVTGAFDLRGFSRYGVGSAGWLAYGGSAAGGSGRNTAIRLDTAYTFADVKTLRRYSGGDFVTTGLSWTRPVHMTGVQVRSDFSMRPDLITFPMPRLSGSAAVPSTVDVLTDGNLTVSHSVDAGPFEIPQLPVVTGAGTISMTVTNALGQQVTVNQPFYASSSLLSPGLQTFGGQIGLVRRGWGVWSNDYGKIAGVAVYRRGLSRVLTIEGRAEGTPGVFTAGEGAVLQIGNLGVINFAASPSVGEGHGGALFSAGAQRIGRVISVGGAAQIATRQYRDIAALNESGVVRKQVSGFASYYSHRYGSLGLAYADQRQDQGPSLSQGGTSPAVHSRTMTVNYSIQIHRAAFFATFFNNRSGKLNNNTAQFGMTIALGRNRSASAFGSSDGSRQVQVQQAAPQVGDWGYQFYAAGGSGDHEFALGQYKSTYGLFSAGVDHGGGATTLRFETQNSVSLMDKSVFLANTISDSFGVVDTRPLSNVRVYQENRYAGTTGHNGRLLVPDLRAFDANRLTINPTDVPADVSMPSDTREIRPQDRSGVLIHFGIRLNRAALLQLVRADGKPVPEGSTATLAGSRALYPVGYDGQAYLEDLGAHNVVTVEDPDGQRCRVEFDYHPVPGDIPVIGPLRCVEKVQ